MDLVAGDRYRIEVRSGGLFKGLLASLVSRTQPDRVSGGPPDPVQGSGTRRPSRGQAGGIVSIVDRNGAEVWSRPCLSVGERNELIRIIEEQVMTARLEDFEHWLRTEGAEDAR